jgi:hypothetical protein
MLSISSLYIGAGLVIEFGYEPYSHSSTRTRRGMFAMLLCLHLQMIAITLSYILAALHFAHSFIPKVRN